MPDHLGTDQRKTSDDKNEEKQFLGMMMLSYIVQWECND